MRSTIFFITLCCVVKLYGREVPVDKAEACARNFLAKTGYSVKGALTTIHTRYVTDRATFYIFSEPGMFVIVSAEDAVSPILAYSLENGFPSGPFPSNVSYMLSRYESQIVSLIESGVQSQDIMEEWSALMGNQTRFEAKTQAVSPLISTTWNQSSGYNSYCPSDPQALSGYSGHVPTGCIATAMSQVMKYWKWPLHGISSHTYQSAYGIESANFSAANYVWDAMPQSSGGNATARLMYHCGVAVNMQYSATGSGAYTSDAKLALKEYFCYDQSGISIISKKDYSAASWFSAIKQELDASQPVIYVGIDGGAGHAWVVDGYDNNNFLHCNWGWGGSVNGYFLPSAMDPYPTKNYNENQEVIVGIRPLFDAPLVKPDSVCAGFAKHIKGEPEGGIWMSDNSTIVSVSASGDIIGMSSGTAIVRYSVSNSCGARTATTMITVLGTSFSYATCDRISSLSEDAAILQHMVTVYPNPSNGTFSVDVNRHVSDLRITVTDMEGRVLFVAAPGSSEPGTVATFMDLKSGIYIVSIFDGQSLTHQRLAVH